MALDAMWALSEVWYTGRLERDYEPPSIDELQSRLSAAGLTADFWQLAG